jgi:BlaI family transcriptional regulator, penicillinase repressor
MGKRQERTSMGKVPREITDTELQLLNELWQRPSATVPELTEALYGNTPPALLATVRTLLTRLEEKGCVSRDRSRWPHHYKAAVKREELADNRLQAAADELYDGDLAPLLTHLVRSERLTAEDREKLRKVLDELDRKRPGKGK